MSYRIAPSNFPELENNVLYRPALTQYESLSSNYKAQTYEYTREEHELHPVRDVSKENALFASHRVWWRTVPNPVTYVWRETAKDLRRIGWRRIMDVGYNHVLPNFAMLSLVAITIYLTLTTPVNLGQQLCRPDGTPTQFRAGSNWTFYNPWDTSEMFTINMGFGNLPFGQAKLIDVIWDTVFGRGGQALLAFISYRVLTSAASLLIEQGSVTFGTYEAITLDGSTMLSIAKLLRDVRKNKGPRCRTLIPFIIFSIVLVLIFPTLASAMTGYSANFDAQIKTSNGSTIPAASLQKVWYIIQDGSRLGQGFYDGYPITDLNNGELDLSDPYLRLGFNVSAQAVERSRPVWLPGCSRYAPGKIDNNNISLRPTDTTSPMECQLLWNVSYYTSKYGLLGFNNVTSSFYNIYEQKQVSIPSPALNITVYQPSMFLYTSGFEPLFKTSNLTWSIMPYGLAWYHGKASFRLADRQYAYRSSRNNMTVLNETEVLGNLTCRQQSPGADSVVRYQWGFAFQPLVVFTILLMVWTTIVYAIHVHVRRHSQLVQQHRVIGLKRAVIDLAPAYQQHFDRDVAMCSESDLHRMANSGHISYEKLVRSHPVTTRGQRSREWRKAFRFGKWLKSEWITLSLMLVVLALIPTSMLAPRLYYIWGPFLCPLFVGFIPILAAGKKHFSRWLLYLPFLALFLGLDIWLIVRVNTYSSYY